jgi:putative transposase
MRMMGLSLPIRGRRHNGRPHRGQVAQEQPDRRRCTDGFEILCWNGQIVSAAFALDCCDREAIAFVARVGDLRSVDIRRLMRQAVFARFGSAGPPSPVQWLSENGSVFTALDTITEAERLNLVPITTPVASPESNGMAEAFVNTLRPDYVDGADLSTGTKVIEQMAGWIADYNGFAPHSALGERSPAEYRREWVTT